MIAQEFITKIEGHGALDVDWAKKRVQLKILEGERLFEGILNGRPAEEAPWITSRICGICPIAHNLASLKAVEAALGIIPNQTTILLRKLMTAAQIIQSHTLHLFFLALPDYLGLDSGLELAKKKPEFFKIAVNLKEISDQISQTIAGRSIHPTTTTIGGFHKIPDKKILEDLARKLDKNFNFAVAGAEVFSRLHYPQYNIDLEFISQTGRKDYPGYESSEIISSKNDYSEIEKYQEDIQEEIRKNSTAKFAKYKKREVMVGALARLATHQNYLAPVCKKYLKEIDFKNPFYNNLAQAVEILNFYQKARDIVGVLLKEELDSRIISPSNHPSLKGIGAVEAPRGGLYHEIHLDDKGKIIFANIITPTVQNLTSIEKSAQAILDQSPKISLEEARKLIEMLIRAYDPCITCAVH
jgi:coenzyme F420-reducing hydrogenase alpha subunit